MFRQSSSFVLLLTCSAVFAVALVGCGEEPVSPRLIGFSPAVLTVPADEAIAISVEYEENDFALQDFRWTVEAGEIEGNGAPSITYHAPADPGDYKITVTVAYGDDNATLSLDSVVKVTAPVATTAPPVAEASEPATTAPTQPTERATTAAEQPAEANAPATGKATEEAVAATEEAPPPAATAQNEGAAEQTTSSPAASGQAVEEAPAATAATPSTTAPVAAVEEAAAPAAQPEGPAPSRAGEATGQAAQRSEQPTPATAAGVPEGAGEAAAVADEGSKEPARDVAAAAEETGGEGQRAGREPTPASNAPEPAADEAAPAAEPAPAAESAPEVAALTEAPVAPPAAAGSRLDQILERHRLTAVVQIALKPFSFYGEDGRRTGFEIDFLREFARRWLDDPTAVTFLPVPTDARIPTLQKGRADLIAAALTKTPARAEEVDFSLTYFKDGQRLLVPENSAVADVCDLKGKKVAAIRGSTSLDNVKAAAAKCGFDLGADLVTFRRHEDAIEALLEGQVDAYTSDGVALESIAEGRPLKVVGNHFSEEPYGFAVRKGDKRLLDLINHTLEEMARDGTYAAIYEKWFGDSIRPYPLEETETVAATEVAALATTSAPPIVAPKTAPAEPVETYVVQAGDTLSRIAGKVYGDVSPSSWERIYQANREVIGDDPSRIKVGMKLTIPQ